MNNVIIAILAIVFCFTQYGNVAAVDNQELDRRISSARDDVNKKSNEHSQNLKKLKEVEDQIDQQTKQVEEILKQKKDLEDKISESRANIQESKKFLKAAIRNAYIKGEASELDVLFQQKNEEELIDTSILVQYVSDKVKALIEKANAEISKSKEIKKDLEARKEQLEITRGKLGKTQEEYIKLCEITGQKVDKAKATQGQLEDEKRKNEEEVNKASREINEQIQKESKKELNNPQNSQNIPKVGGGWCWPVPSSRLISSPFRPSRFHPILKIYRSHDGVDIAASAGADILAAESGVVVNAGDSGELGIHCTIDHGNGRTTLYGHMSRRYVRNGEPVKKGQRLGLIGMTGLADGDHLHFEYSENGVLKDPLTLY